MIPAKRDITIRFGDVHEIFFRVRRKVWDGTAWVNDGYQDLTGYQVLIQVRKTTETDALLGYAITFGDQTDDVYGKGAVYAKIGSSETGSLDRKLTTGVYDIQITDADGNPRTYVEGDVEFTKDVSRV